MGGGRGSGSTDRVVATRVRSGRLVCKKSGGGQEKMADSHRTWLVILFSVRDFADRSEMENIGGLRSEQVSPGRLLS
jgi:hypothetical protein